MAGKLDLDFHLAGEKPLNQIFCEKGGGLLCRDRKYPRRDERPKKETDAQEGKRALDETETKNRIRKKRAKNQRKNKIEKKE